MDPNIADDCPIEIDSALVESLVADQFPEWSGRSITMVQPGGWDNRTFRLGDELLVRLPSHAAYVAQVAKEHRFLPFLARSLPLAVPVPLALGRPALGYPWQWSVYGWLEGEPASGASIGDVDTFAHELAGFLRALHGIDPAGGPAPGQHNFFRGGSLLTYDQDTRRALGALRGRVDSSACTRVWEAALAAITTGPAEWLHGDVAASNLLVQAGRLTAVLDFGLMAVGDVACDLAVAWTLFDGSARDVFRQRIARNEATWARARGWALWKALILIAWRRGPSDAVADAGRVLDAVLAE
jgi:aminoglycoside phosphotransferase (APT) family kinase protein